MLIYNRQRTEIVNLNVMQCLKINTHYAKGIYDVCCDAQEESFLLGRYKSIDKAVIAMNKILNAYGDGIRVFFMPQD